MRIRKWLFAGDKNMLVNLDHVAQICIDNKKEVTARFANEHFADVVLFPPETGVLGFDHLYLKLMGEEED